MLADPTVAPDVRAVAPTSSTSTALTANGTNWTTSVVGTTPDWLPVRARTVASGRFFTAGRARPACSPRWCSAPRPRTSCSASATRSARR